MDHEHAIADACVRVVARAGVAGVSMRVVATEAGVSLARVQRTVGTKHDLLVLAASRVVALVDESVAQAGLDEDAAPANFLRQLVRLLLGMREQGIAWLAFVAHALTDPALRTILAQRDHEAREAIAMLLTSFSTDPRLDALALLALLDGLGTQLLLGTCNQADAANIVSAHLDRLLGPA